MIYHNGPHRSWLDYYTCRGIDLICFFYKLKISREYEKIKTLQTAQNLHQLLGGKQEALARCWANAGPPSTTSAQHWPNNGPIPHVSAAPRRLGVWSPPQFVSMDTPLYSNTW